MMQRLTSNVSWKQKTRDSDSSSTIKRSCSRASWMTRQKRRSCMPWSSTRSESASRSSSAEVSRKRIFFKMPSAHRSKLRIRCTWHRRRRPQRKRRRHPKKKHQQRRPRMRLPPRGNRVSNCLGGRRRTMRRTTAMTMTPSRWTRLPRLKTKRRMKRSNKNNKQKKQRKTQCLLQSISTPDSTSTFSTNRKLTLAKLVSKASSKKPSSTFRRILDFRCT
mmetsp:Transcript_4321/g.12382  ORF Transcript_4321/g.12382 Transcript_4321/m.12382 type:complete len:219 (-) Transcript_4321:832-1488(-)